MHDLAVFIKLIEHEPNVHIFPAHGERGRRTVDRCYDVFIDNVPVGFKYDAEGQKDRHVLRVGGKREMAIWHRGRLGRSPAVERFQQLMASLVKTPNTPKEHGSILRRNVTSDQLIKVLREIACLAQRD